MKEAINCCFSIPIEKQLFLRVSLENALTVIHDHLLLSVSMGWKNMHVLMGQKNKRKKILEMGDIVLYQQRQCIGNSWASQMQRGPRQPRGRGRSWKESRSKVHSTIAHITSILTDAFTSWVILRIFQ